MLGKIKIAFLQKLLQKWKKGGFSVVFWDGSKSDYGNEAPKFSVIFQREPEWESPQGETDLVLIFGEAYMDGVIDIQGSMDALLRTLMLNTWPQAGQLSPKAVVGKPDVESEKNNISHHYDLGNDFFSLWLDKTLSYSCAYFHTPEDSLEQAQLNKIDLVLKKLLLQRGESLLDIGCGWGVLMIRAAQNYGVQVTGVTLSREQYEKVQSTVRELGLEKQVTVKLAGYEELRPEDGQFDKIVSIGMFEHVGEENHLGFMTKVQELLKPEGLFLLHTITGMFESMSNAWLGKYIFPGGYVPSLREVIWLLPEFDLHLLHAESLRLHYAMTLDRWYGNYAEHADEVRAKYGERFARMWSLYLRGCASAFRAAGLDVYQLLCSKGLNNDLPLTYKHLR